jgi:putative aldouronate transport system substrate-binding protein
MAGCNKDEGKDGAKVPEVTWMMRASGATMYTNELKIYDWLGEAGGCTVKVTAVAPDVYMDRLSVLVASKTLPDIVNIGNQDLFVEAVTPDFTLVQEIGPKGLLIALSDHWDKLPHMKAWLDKYPDYVKSITASDGKVYFAPVVRDYSPTSSLGAVIRSDLSRNMKFDSFDALLLELMEMRKNAKGPIWTNRSGLLNLNLLAYSFGTSFTDFPYYDQYAKKFINPVGTKNFKDAVEFFKTLVDKDILTKEWANYPEPQWYKDAMDGTCQFWVDNMMNVPTHNKGLKAAGITGQFEAFVPPPYAGKFYGWPGKSRLSTTGSVVSAKTDNMDEVLAILDWTYDISNHDRMYWGELGITYELSMAGKPQIPNLGDGLDAYNKLITTQYGIGENSNWMKVFTDAEFYNYRTVGARDWQPAGQVYGENVYSYSVPAVNLNPQEADQYKNLYTPVSTYIQESVTNFINGKKPMSEWDAFAKKVTELGGDDIVKAYNTALAR